MPTAFLWFPAVAVAAHLIEEFVWPGGFAEWYRHYPPGETVMVSDRLLVIVNVVFGILALLPPILGPTPRGVAFAHRRCAGHRADWLSGWSLPPSPP